MYRRGKERNNVVENRSVAAERIERYNEQGICSTCSKEEV
jgi:hypothetical protein